MTRGIVYYTHGQGDALVLAAARAQITRAAPDLPIVSCTLTPLDFGHNVVLTLAPSILTMFRQQLAALQASSSDLIYFCEHDVLYHPSHFAYIPPTLDLYHFNLNVWSVDVDDGKSLTYDGMKMTSGLVAGREILIEHYLKKIAWVEREGKFRHNLMGFEPGRKVSKGRPDDYDWTTFRSAYPNIDLKGTWNITRKRFTLADYRNRRHMEATWRLGDGVPGWGQTKGRVREFLEGLL